MGGTGKAMHVEHVEERSGHSSPSEDTTTQRWQGVKRNFSCPSREPREEDEPG
jgi:hypothetical protein